MGYHQHDDCEISVVLEGNGIFEFENQSWTIEAGHVIIIPSAIPHNYKAVNPIRFGVLQYSSRSKTLDLLFQRLVDNQKPTLHWMSPLDLQQYESLFRSWLKMISKSLNETDQVTATWIQLLMLYVIEHSQMNHYRLSISSAAEYIKMGLSDSLRVDDMAKLSGLSVSQFRRTFLAAYGMSPKQYQQQCRLTEAKWLLRSTNKSIYTIAESLGFQHLHSFSAWFQKSEGHSPSVWRRIQQGTRDDY